MRDNSLTLPLLVSLSYG
uniref:Uncharacterized protein n=1 Tax=Anguilla anguilla TaxID=7936 RepID=A0A0E9PDX7_ANGAN